MNTSEIIAAHEAKGHYIEIDNIRTFVLEEGKGEPILCLHGVPSSSFLYRKILPVLGRRGYRAISFDFPGLGLSDRPGDFDYSWHGIAAFAKKVTAALNLNKYHLVIHDIGGPIGLLLASLEPGKISSLTILNTVIEVSTFHRPWSMHPFSIPVIGELWLATLNHFSAYILFSMQAIGDLGSVSRQEVYAYVDLLKRADGGAAFLKIMRSFNLDKETEEKCIGALKGVASKQVIWGKDDPALALETFGERARQLAEVSEIHTLPGKHFFQEDQAKPIAEKIAGFVNSLKK